MGDQLPSGRMMVPPGDQGGGGGGGGGGDASSVDSLLAEMGRAGCAPSISDVLRSLDVLTAQSNIAWGSLHQVTSAVAGLQVAADIAAGDRSQLMEQNKSLWMGITELNTRFQAIEAMAESFQGQKRAGSGAPEVDLSVVPQLLEEIKALVTAQQPPQPQVEQPTEVRDDTVTRMLQERVAELEALQAKHVKEKEEAMSRCDELEAALRAASAGPEKPEKPEKSETQQPRAQQDAENISSNIDAEAQAESQVLAEVKPKPKVSSLGNVYQPQSRDPKS